MCCRFRASACKSYKRVSFHISFTGLFCHVVPCPRSCRNAHRAETHTLDIRAADATHTFDICAADFERLRVGLIQLSFPISLLQVSFAIVSPVPDHVAAHTFDGEVGGWGRVPFSRNFMKPTPHRKWYLTTGRRFH